MTRIWPLAVLLVCAIACTAKKESVEGTWTGSVLIKRPSTGKAKLDELLAKADQTPVQYTLELRADKTYTETVHTDKIDGTWVEEGRDIILTPKTVNGKDPAKLASDMEKANAALQININLPPGLDGPEQVTISDDRKTLSIPSIGTSVTMKRGSIPAPAAPTMSLKDVTGHSDTGGQTDRDNH
jgi:hypothetical protein